MSTRRRKASIYVDCFSNHYMIKGILKVLGILGQFPKHWQTKIQFMFWLYTCRSKMSMSVLFNILLRFAFSWMWVVDKNIIYCYYADVLLIICFSFYYFVGQFVCFSLSTLADLPPPWLTSFVYFYTHHFRQKIFKT